MVKPQRKPAAKAPPPKGQRRPEEDALGLSDSDDDDFKSRKDKVSLNMSDDEQDDDSLDVEGVYDLDEGEDEDEDEEDDGDEDDDDIIEDALKQGGSIAELARQAKALGQKLKLQRGEDDEDEDEEEEEEEEGGRRRRKGKGEDEDEALGWGANKRAYYDADTAEASDDEEAVKGEEKEALALQRARAAKLAASDFGLADEEEEDEEEDDEDESDDGDEEEEATMGALGSRAGGAAAAAAAGGKQKQRKQRQGAGGVQVEEVARDLAALGDEARMSALLADAPELLSLLGDLQDSLGEVRHRVSPLLSELRDGGLATCEGLSYLEAKHLLLLSYCTHIVFYLLLKAEGRPVRDHPVIGRLVELRAYLEKVRPIDKQLSYQIDKLLRAASMAAAAEAPGGSGRDADGAAGPGPGSAAAGLQDGDALQYGPRPDALVPKNRGAAAAAGGGDAGGDDGGGVYRAPRMVPTSMEMDERRAAGGEAAALTTQERRRLKELKSKSARPRGATEAEEALRASLRAFTAICARARDAANLIGSDLPDFARSAATAGWSAERLRSALDPAAVAAAACLSRSSCDGGSDAPAPALPPAALQQRGSWGLMRLLSKASGGGSGGSPRRGFRSNGCEEAAAPGGISPACSMTNARLGSLEAAAVSLVVRIQDAILYDNEMDQLDQDRAYLLDRINHLRLHHDSLAAQLAPTHPSVATCGTAGADVLLSAAAALAQSQQQRQAGPHGQKQQAAAAKGGKECGGPAPRPRAEVTRLVDPDDLYDDVRKRRPSPRWLPMCFVGA
ncbi:Neuroguidin [Tetrabaena socialis]|uniref:Neuroguidin n=1 Tax=Tetrabaena socialis TaxID=47790 RepID=A0A2J8ACS5_9CHLO|nr:Neuroguidin [Tetrabaena socialis]|eukprot:PNH10325.1 Neuroguidin [Tetrabaena socialis]